MSRLPKPLFILFLVLTLHFTLPTLHCLSAVPHLINYQGKLTDPTGKPVSDGTYSITFRIYDAETAGNLLWQETQTVLIQKGIFSVLLGGVTNLDLAFDKPYFLEIVINNEVMSPRQRITSSGYAIRAEVAETIAGKQLSDILNRANHTGTQPTSTITGTFAPTILSPQGSGSGLNTDMVDGLHASQIRGGPFSCTVRSTPGGWTHIQTCSANGEWCIQGEHGGGESMSCSTTNPGFGDWRATCCK